MYYFKNFFLFTLIALLVVQCQKDDSNTDIANGSEETEKTLSRDKLKKRAVALYNSREYRAFSEYEGRSFDSLDYYIEKIDEKYPDPDNVFYPLFEEMEKSGEVELTAVYDSEGNVVGEKYLFKEEAIAYRERNRERLKKKAVDLFNSQEYKNWAEYRGGLLDSSIYYLEKIDEKYPDYALIPLFEEMEESGEIEYIIASDSVSNSTGNVIDGKYVFKQDNSSLVKKKINAINKKELEKKDSGERKRCISSCFKSRRSCKNYVAKTEKACIKRADSKKGNSIKRCNKMSDYQEKMKCKSDAYNLYYSEKDRCNSVSSSGFRQCENVAKGCVENCYTILHPV